MKAEKEYDVGNDYDEGDDDDNVNDVYVNYVDDGNNDADNVVNAI